MRSTHVQRQEPPLALPNPPNMSEFFIESRSIDELGRVVLPRTARDMLGWRELDTVRVLVDAKQKRMVLELANDRDDKRRSLQTWS